MKRAAFFEERPDGQPAVSSMVDSPQGVSIACVGNAWFPTAPGGLDRYVYELTQCLGSAGDRIDLYGVGFPEEASDFPASVINLADPKAGLWQRFWQSRRQFLCCQSQGLSAVNIHFALYGWPLLGVLPKGVPVTTHFHGPWALESQREGAGRLSVALKKWIERRVYRRCDRFIVLSQAFGNILHAEYGVPWDKIRVIPGGVNTQQFCMTRSRSAAREALGWPDDRFVLFTPRRLVQRMGLDHLLDALAQLKADGVSVWLAIAGKGEMRSQLEQQAQSLGLAEDVRFLGFLPEAQLPLAYEAADLTVMPSQALEGFGLVLLESLACGTPVLCTPVGGMPEVIADFSPALITESPKTGAIAQSLRGILAGEQPLPSRQACRRYAEDTYSWPVIAPRVRAVLLESIAKV